MSAAGVREPGDDGVGRVVGLNKVSETFPAVRDVGRVADVAVARAAVALPVQVAFKVGVMRGAVEFATPADVVLIGVSASPISF